MTLARQNTAIQQAEAGTAAWIPHLSINEVQGLAAAALIAARNGKGERDALIIQTIFDGCFRVTEALSLTPNSLRETQDGWSARIVGKGGKAGEVAVSASLVARLHQYAYQHSIGPNERFFACNKHRVWQIVNRAFEVTGIPKPEHVGTVHVPRHSGALARLAQTGNPKALQDQLRHVDARMTIRYLKTLSAQESLRINQGVDFRW